jgi:uncharacterized protein
MQVQRYSSPEAFYNDAESFLMRNEAINCLPLGLTTGMIRQPGVYENPYFAIAREGGEVVGAAVRTPPYNFLIGKTESNAAIEAMLEDAAQLFDRLRGVLGTKDNSLFAAQRWEQISGQKMQPGMRERIYQLERVIPVQGVSGHLRKADENDRERLTEWIYGFQVDAFGADQVDMETIRRNVDGVVRYKTRDYFFWEDGGQPVAMAAYTGFTPNGARIGPVYTPVEHRRRGYGSAVTAAVTQLLLDSGRKRCFLFTDLNNPTSNHIYQTIGYEPVCDMDEWLFA